MFILFIMNKLLFRNLGTNSKNMNRKFSRIFQPIKTKLCAYSFWSKQSCFSRDLRTNSKNSKREFTRIFHPIKTSLDEPFRIGSFVIGCYIFNEWMTIFFRENTGVSAKFILFLLSSSDTTNPEFIQIGSFINGCCYIFNEWMTHFSVKTLEFWTVYFV